MPRTGIAHLPLHGGSAPRWLFDRMVKLARHITLVLVEDYGPHDVLARLSDPYWFQAFGCLLGFDWHSSGLTTVVCGALKEALRGLEVDTGLLIAGGKGRTSRQTPSEIERLADRFSFQPQPLVYASRLAAKVDSAALQDGYQIYHHTFIFTPGGPASPAGRPARPAGGRWAVVQQGMPARGGSALGGNEATRYARRYHWLSDAVSDFVCEPHNAIISDSRGFVLNMVARESDSARAVSAELARSESPDRLIADLQRLQAPPPVDTALDLPQRHHLHPSDINPGRLQATLRKAHQAQPQDFERLLGSEGVGPATIRALALIAELVHGTPVSVRDPARFSFAHGGKDGHPYPVDRDTYDRSIEALRRAVHRARLGHHDKLAALRRLAAAAAP